MAEDRELTQKLTVVLTELGDLMKERKDRIESLRSEITMIENENEDLEKKIQEIMMGF
tara:strand:- start:980 stop:1153 length:174 start_codon:yes stop_codon:yes gene_type:complete